jgi:23S rRNA pseudouridine1911/1915/1917 synthase
VENEIEQEYQFVITGAENDQRIDLFLGCHIKGLTRSRGQGLIRDGFVKVNEHSPKTSYRIKTGDLITIHIPSVIPYHLEPEPVDFSVIHEDASLIVLDKPAGLVIHPAPGHLKGTLVQGLLQHCSDLSGIGGVLRPGIVHRLDKDTSGVLVVAKNDNSHNFLAKQFKQGTIKKQYLALVHGRVNNIKGQINLPITRNPNRRKEMVVLPDRGKGALTYWEKLEDLAGCFSLISVRPKTGRTHQIRVHFAHIGHPIAGDRVYGYRQKWWKQHPSLLSEIAPIIKRQMLHAECIGFIHPDSKDYREFYSPIPDDMKEVIHRYLSEDSV